MFIRGLVDYSWDRVVVQRSFEEKVGTVAVGAMFYQFVCVCFPHRISHLH